FIDLLGKARTLRRKLEKEFRDLYDEFSLVGAEVSPAFLEGALMAPEQTMEIQMEEKNIMGVTVPEFTYGFSQDKTAYPYGFATTNSGLDRSILQCVQMLPDIVELAQLEKSCDSLADEIEKVRRRVNALEFMTIPQLHHSIRFIQMKLDENERGNLVRLMKVKNKLKQGR
ncbi:MAG TPA: V-type ATP synthase subunit D, partial [Candidatus Merdenecus merdavium]|nr:V-type ATP synthase subunit D [Candidatus Merdenecus merdavium]